MILLTLGDIDDSDIAKYSHIWVRKMSTTRRPGGGITTFSGDSIFEILGIVAEHHPDDEIVVRGPDVLRSLRQSG